MATFLLTWNPTKWHWNDLDETIAEVERTGSYFSPAPDQVPDAEYTEGAVHRVAVNAFERNAAARAVCIEYYGCMCCVCGFDFAERYGAVGSGLVHVHHLVPLSDIGRRYVVDPVKDLRPVCRNCHAILHRAHPPYSVDEVRAMLRV
jgi:5-methylcytosine-specific restriction enzyme A